MKEKLKIGFLVNSTDIERWKYDIIEEIRTSNYAEVELFVINDTKPTTLSTKLWKYRKNVVYALHDKFDSFISVKILKKYTNAFAKVPLGKTYENVNKIRVRPEQTPFTDSFPKEQLDEIRDLQLDVLIRFGFRILKGDILKAAKHGVWSYHHGDNFVNRGGPPGYWEVVKGWKETGCVLQKLSSNLDGGEILYRTWVSTYKYNIQENKNRIYWRASKIIPRMLQKLHESGDQEFYKFTRSFNQHPDYYTGMLYKAPGNFQALLHLANYFHTNLKQIRDVLFYRDQWFVLLRRNKSEIQEKSFRRLKPLVPDKDKFWADPFHIYKNDYDYIFVEEFPFKTKKGYISVIKLNEKQEVMKVEKVLERDYHLSYPFIFQYNDDFYMIPETSQNKTIELYKCTKFPNQWELDKIIFDNIAAVDTTLFFHNELWWMFTSIDETQKISKNEELFLFYSSNPISGDWTPHPLNPIISDAKVARPGGNLFRSNGKLYRPSQNCIGKYGSSININEIIEMSTTNYQEKMVKSLKPDWDKDIGGIHTLNISDRGFTIIDAYKKKRKKY